MNPLIIDASEDSPSVIFDTTAKHFTISGKSRPENTGKFYNPVIDWIIKFEDNLAAGKNKADNSAIVFSFKLEYFNSISAKYIADIILILKDFIVKGYPFNIEWHSAKFDDDMLDAGKEFADMVDLEFDFIEY